MSSDTREELAVDASSEDWGALAVSIPGWKCRPDLLSYAPYRVNPDHWAWEGWLLRLLGGPVVVTANGTTCLVQCSGVHGKGTTLGRAIIATAAALGRWPGLEVLWVVLPQSSLNDDYMTTTEIKCAACADQGGVMCPGYAGPRCS